MPNATGPSSMMLGLNHLARLKSDQLGFYRDMQARYGDAVPVRLGPYRNWLLFHPDHAEAVLAKQAENFRRFEPTMRILAQWTGQDLFVVEGEAWRERRRQVLPAFASKRLPEYGNRIVARAAALRRDWESRCDDGLLTVDTDAEMIALTITIVGDTLFGEPLDDATGTLIRAVGSLSDIAFRESTMILPMPRFVPTRHNRRKAETVSVMNRMVDRIVSPRLQGEFVDRGDLLSMLIEQCGADRQAVHDEVLTLLIAGHETSSAGMSWCAMLLGSAGRDVRRRLLDEIRNAVGDRLPTFADLADMPFLRAVCSEALRLYPPGYTMFLRRANNDIDVRGARIRKDEVVQIVPWISQRDPRWFEAPDNFVPDRFLAEPTWPSYAYLPFSVGPRVCIGQSFALMELALALATLLQRFEPMAPSKMVEPEAKFSLRPRGGLPQVWRLH